MPPREKKTGEEIRICSIETLQPKLQLEFNCYAVLYVQIHFVSREKMGG